MSLSPSPGLSLLSIVPLFVSAGRSGGPRSQRPQGGQRRAGETSLWAGSGGEGRDPGVCAGGPALCAADGLLFLLQGPPGPPGPLGPLGQPGAAVSTGESKGQLRLASFPGALLLCLWSSGPLPQATGVKQGGVWPLGRPLLGRERGAVPGDPLPCSGSLPTQLPDGCIRSPCNYPWTDGAKRPALFLPCGGLFAENAVSTHGVMLPGPGFSLPEGRHG